MGWLWVWLQDRQERRAEAAVRRQMAAVEGSRGVDSIDVEPVADDGLPPVDVDDPATWPADFDDGPAAYDPAPMTPLRPPGWTPPLRGQEVALMANLVDLLEECRRVDVLDGKRGGFVTTARIRELLRGKS